MTGGASFFVDARERDASLKGEGDRRAVDSSGSRSERQTRILQLVPARRRELERDNKDRTGRGRNVKVKT